MIDSKKVRLIKKLYKFLNIQSPRLIGTWTKEQADRVIQRLVRENGDAIINLKI